MITKKLSALIFICCFAVNVFAQQSKQNQRIKLSVTEKLWAISHPQKAIKAYKCANLALKITDSLEKKSILLGASGGQLDAFKHVFYMALLYREIGEETAIKLGNMHEQSNYRSFLNGESKHDKASCDMDLWNNSIGIKIGSQFQDSSNIFLINIIIETVVSGKAKIIKKDKNGNFLDVENKIIKKEEIFGIWDNPKCLVYSNWKQ